LEKAYLGVEQQNADARYLVRRKARIVYAEYVQATWAEESTPNAGKIEFVRKNAVAIVGAVVKSLLEDYKASKEIKVEQETAHLAISLIVADAVIECEVLERPLDASPA
jgi:hypothetical protein